MKNKLLFLICLIPFLFGFVGSSLPISREMPYGPNEVLEYRIHYGFMNAGEARIEVHPKLYLVNNKVCYKATVTGKSTGAFDFALRIRDQWGTYIDTSSKNPQRAFRTIEEGKYRLKEYAYFDYKNNEVNLERETKGNKKETRVYSITDDVQDIISGYYFLRTINYNALHLNDTIAVNAFFEDKLYNFSVKFLGKGQVKTKFGSINAIKLSPIMPENQLFEGGNSIRLWLSDDKNKIPIKVEADMVVGAVEIDLKGYEGLKHPICFK